MALISETAVRRGLRRLSDERALSFVAALWAARGAETTVDHERDLVEARRKGRTEQLRVVTGRAAPARRAGERLVLLRPAADVRGVDGAGCIDADDVRQLLLYGVPRDAAAALCRRYFDRPLTETTGAEPHPLDPARLPEQSASVVVGLVGLLLVVASVFGGPLLVNEPVSEFGAAIGAQPFGDSAAQTTPPEANDTDSTQRTDVTGAQSLQMGGLPPGVTADGSIDEGVLANAHARAVTGQSYRLTITHRELVDGRETAYRRETVFVAAPNRYRTELTGAGRLQHSTLSIASVEAYADGSSRFERQVTDDGFDRAPPRPQTVRGVRNGEGRYADRVEDYIEWYLSVSESSIVDIVERNGTRYFWLTLGADPYVGVENSSGSALVDENGVVHEVRRQYDVPRSDGVSAVVSFRYTDFGSTTVSPPAWHETRTNTTPAATTESVTTTPPTTVTPGPANRSDSRERIPAATVATAVPTAKADG